MNGELKAMVKSMTGFGRGEFASEAVKVTVEIKAVNHRYLDLNIKMIKRLNPFENDMRNLVKDYIARGKVDIFVNFEEVGQDASSLRLQDDVAGKYIEFAARLHEKFGVENDMTATKLMRFSEVIVEEEPSLDEDEVEKALMSALEDALKQICRSRLDEGRKLRDDILLKCQNLGKNVALIEERYPEIIESYKTRLKQKIDELKADTSIDESRLAMEVTMFADKICVDEETVRLRSHIDAITKTLDEGTNIGRKLDFIAQELNREANTILSKANDLITSDIAIELKTDIEKIREQIQNVE